MGRANGSRRQRHPECARSLASAHDRLADQQVFDTQLAISESGDAVVGWLQGRPPVVCAGGPCLHPRPWHGFKVMVAQGTTAGGFGRPIEVNAHGYDDVFAAQLSSGISYLAWDPVKGRGWRIVAIDQGRVSKPMVLPADAQLQGLFTGRKREAAAVWATPGNPAWHLHYAFLGPNGRLGRQGTLALLRGDFTYPSIALNDRGQFAALWTKGSQSDSSAFLAVCDAHGRCSQPHRLGAVVTSAYNTVALTDRGTAVALVGARSGLWAAIARVGRSGVRSVRVSSTGIDPIAVPDGVGGVAATFVPSPTSVTWTFLDPSTGRFSGLSPRTVPAGAPPAEVAASLSGRFVFSWSASDGLRVMTGAGTRVGQSTVILGSQDAEQGDFNVYDTLSDDYVGIDGRGNVVITWENGTHGLTAAVHLAR